MPKKAVTRLEAIRKLADLVDDLAGHVEYLREEGVTEVGCSSSGLPQSGKVLPPVPKKSTAPNISMASRVSSGDGGAELKAIAKAVAACTQCVLHEKRRQAVPGQGNIHPDILFVGEGPGEDEDRQGLAFIGRAGQLLTRLITRMGYTRDEVFIANIVKCRPPGNRKPLPEEMAACFPYLKAQIAALQPKVIVALGATALEALVSPLVKISRTRGTWQAFGEFPLMPTYHPSYLLRNQSAMWDVWNDMQLVLTRLGRTPPPSPAKGK